MKIIARFIIALAMGLLLSINDFAWPATDCPFTIIETEIDQDGNTLFSIIVNEIDGSDAACVNFGRCVYDLIGTATGMAAVEIVNFDGHWVPSKWKWIDVTRASVLAEEIDLEELAYMSSYTWEGGERD